MRRTAMMQPMTLAASRVCRNVLTDVCRPQHRSDVLDLFGDKGVDPSIEGAEPFSEFVEQIFRVENHLIELGARNRSATQRRDLPVGCAAASSWQLLLVRPRRERGVSRHTSCPQARVEVSGTRRSAAAAPASNSSSAMALPVSRYARCPVSWSTYARLSSEIWDSDGDEAITEGLNIAGDGIPSHDRGCHRGDEDQSYDADATENQCPER